MLRNGLGPEPAAHDIARHAGSVIVLAGASCVGKTTMLERIRDGDHSMLPALPDSFDVGACDIRNAMDLVSRANGPAPGRTLLVHYDLFRPITFHGGLDFASDPVLSILRGASDVAALTLWEEPGILQRRSRVRRRRLWRKLVKRPFIGRVGWNYHVFEGARRRRKIMQPWFDDPERLWQIYAAWFEYCRAAGIPHHWIGRSSEEGSFAPLPTDAACTPPWMPAELVR